MTTVAYETSTPLFGELPARRIPRGGKLPFALFILVNAALFVRPAELMPAVKGLPIYNLIIVACLAISFRQVIKQISTRSLKSSPINLCVVGVLFAVALSHASRLDLGANFTYWTSEFAKVLLYFLMMVALVNTPRRLHGFLIWLNLFTLILTAVALLDYHGYIQLPSIAEAKEHMGVDGQDAAEVLIRLCATGIYDNPNDLARILVIGITISLFAIMEKGASSIRFLWIAPMIVFAYALNLTYSRGGLLALMAGIGVLFAARYGWRRSVLAGVIVLPILLAFFGGRQTSFDTQGGTGQHRIQLWAEGLELMRYQAITSPLFGIGAGRMADELGYVAHNSFVHAYVEMGFFGGTLFSGAFFLAAWSIYRLPRTPPPGADRQLWRFRPYLLSIVVGTIVGMLTSTRTYHLPTYMVLGLAACYVRLTADVAPVLPIKFDMRLVRKLTIIGIVFLVATHLYIRFAVNWE